MTKTINSAAVNGEKGTGYLSPKDGPFRCSNCTHFNPTTDGCDGESMKKLSDRPKLPSGDVLVEPGGHCAYFDPKR